MGSEVAELMGLLLAASLNYHETEVPRSGYRMHAALIRQGSLPFGGESNRMETMQMLLTQYLHISILQWTVLS